MCAGTGKVAYNPTAGEEPSPAPYDPGRSPDGYAAAGMEVSTCWQWDCEGGYLRTRLPYQDFKWRYVARWVRSSSFPARKSGPGSPASSAEQQTPPMPGTGRPPLPRKPKP